MPRSARRDERLVQELRNERLGQTEGNHQGVCVGVKKGGIRQKERRKEVAVGNGLGSAGGGGEKDVADTSSGFTSAALMCFGIICGEESVHFERGMPSLTPQRSFRLGAGRADRARRIISCSPRRTEGIVPVCPERLLEGIRW